MHVSIRTFPYSQIQCSLQRSEENKITIFKSHLLGNSEKIYNLMDWYGMSGNISAHSGHYWNIEFFLIFINIFSKSWILMEMSIYQWRCSSWGLGQWSLRICGNWHCFNLYFPHWLQSLFMSRYLCQTCIHWTSNVYGSMWVFLLWSLDLDS